MVDFEDGSGYLYVINLLCCSEWKAREIVECMDGYPGVQWQWSSGIIVRFSLVFETTALQ